MTPVWSVVIPTRNRPGQLRTCLRALTALQYPREAFEVIVVDDGGAPDADLTEPELEGQLQIHVVRQCQSGPAAARNRGASLARGEFLAFTDDDCAPRPAWLCEAERVLRSNPHALVGGRVFNALGGNPYATASQLLIDYLCAEYTQGGQPRFLTSNNLALTRTAFVQLGGFDGSFPLPAGEDREFSERWRRSGGNIQYVGGPVVNHLHELTLRGFLLQHFRYGRGARRLHQVGRRNGWESIRVEPLRFYLKLLMFPRVGSSTRPISCHWLSVLLLTSQVAGVAGYTYEIMSPQAARL